MKDKGEQAVTIKDISEKLNISITSVHRALQGKEGVSDELREKIQKLADEMGYAPNYAAASMKRKKLKIAVVLPVDEGERSFYYDYIWEGIQDYSSTLKVLNVELENCSVNNEEEQYIQLKRIADIGVQEYAGVLTFSFTRRANVLMQMQRLVAQDIKTVVIDDDLKEPEGVFCIPPNEKAIGEVAGEFISLVTPEKGTVLVSGGRDDSKVHKNKIESFKKHLQQNSPGLRIEVIPAYSNLLGKENTLYQELVKALKEIDDVVAVYALTSNDNLPIVEALEDCGKLAAVKIVGSDINEETEALLINGRLHAVINQGAYAKGYMGLQILSDYIVKRIVPEARHYCTIDIVLKGNIMFYTPTKHIKNKLIRR